MTVPLFPGPTISKRYTTLLDATLSPPRQLSGGTSVGIWQLLILQPTISTRWRLYFFYSRVEDFKFSLYRVNARKIKMVMNEKIKRAMKTINKFNWLLIPKVASRLFLSFTEEEKKTELNKPVALNSSESFENAK
ncbi:hypothetical protein [Corynebacterium macginleyi]|uniref:hypothetical protein n=1 Tax=Corynebacterium macginleyi TaxID=38290 RepID=UPI00190B1C0E|nr:hypothetical protein [Corynebacterium macginleyi]